MALALDHVALRTARLAETRRFLEAVLDLKPGPRPPVSVPGYWLYAGPHPIVHLMGVSAEAGAEEGGRARPLGGVDHVALSGGDFERLMARLDAEGVSPKVVELPGTGRRQVFFTAPGGALIEVICD